MLAFRELGRGWRHLFGEHHFLEIVLTLDHDVFEVLDLFLKFADALFFGSFPFVHPS